MNQVKVKRVEKISTFKVITRATRVLSKSDQRKAGYVLAIYILLGLFDVAAVVIFGLIGSLAVSGVAAKEPGSRISAFLEFTGLEGTDLQTQITVLGLAGSAVLIAKSCASLYLSRKTLFFLSRRSALISRKLVNRFLGQDVLRVKQSTVQETIFALTSGVQSVTTRLLAASLLLVSDAFLVVAFSLSLFILDPLVAFSSLGLFSSVALAMYWFMHKRANYLGEKVTELEVLGNNKISEVVSCYRELLVKNRRTFYAKNIGEIRLKAADSGADLNFMNLISKYVIEIALVLGALLVGATQLISQPATRATAVISIFLLSSARIAPAILRIQTGLVSIRASIGTAKPTLDLIEKYLEVDWIEDDDLEVSWNTVDKIHRDFSPIVNLTQVEFSYQNESSPTIPNFTLRIGEGEFLGIAGPSGSGKTSLVDLMLGVLNPDSGTIEISGISPKVVIKEFPGAMAYVPQEVSIVNGSIKENVCLGFKSEEVPDQFVCDLLMQVQLEEILSLPLGIHSPAGERGSKLSGGQRQRIGIARALFTNPKLIILDEATSSLDAMTEKKVSESIKSLRGRITLIVVAHRLSTILEADRIIYMEEGQLKGEGSFSELKVLLPEFRHQAELMGL